MTIPMPRTVGHVTSDPSQADMDVDLPAGTCLLTTTQAESYADARVREALEEILTISADTRYISDIENKISEMLGVLK